MRRVEGGIGVQPIECINPARDRWLVRWDARSIENDNVSYMEQSFDHRPSLEEVKLLILSWYNEQINQRILSGFIWNGMAIWLSGENQFNYKAAYDLATQTGGASLPVTFKFGTDEDPVYHTFSILGDLTDFYMKAMTHVQDTLKSGWEEKDSFNFELYK